MALNYPQLAKVAQNLIDANGQSVTFSRLGRSPANPGQPWRGPNLSDDVTFTCIGVVIPNEEKDDKEAMKRGDATVYIAANDTADQLLEGFDTMTDQSGRVWRVLDVDIINPGSVRVLYTVQLNH